MPPDGGLHRLHLALHAGPDPGGPEAEAAARAAGQAARADGAEVVVVSACLLGEPTRWDGTDRHTPAAVEPLRADARVRLLPLCPEVLGGMGCPRPPVHYEGGGPAGAPAFGDALVEAALVEAAPGVRVVDDAGIDRTTALVLGARRADRLAAAAGAVRALLKERSPSCGVHAVSGPAGARPGRGAFAALLARRQVAVNSEEDVLKPPGQDPEPVPLEPHADELLRRHRPR